MEQTKVELRKKRIVFRQEREIERVNNTMKKSIWQLRNEINEIQGKANVWYVMWYGIVVLIYIINSIFHI